MSDLLHTGLTPEQLQECAKNDALMGIKTAPFSEEELQAGEVERLQRRDQRFRQTLAVVHEMELDAFRRQGWL